MLSEEGLRALGIVRLERSRGPDSMSLEGHYQEGGYFCAILKDETHPVEAEFSLG